MPKVDNYELLHRLFSEEYRYICPKCEGKLWQFSDELYGCDGCKKEFKLVKTLEYQVK